MAQTRLPSSRVSGLSRIVAAILVAGSLTAMPSAYAQTGEPRDNTTLLRDFIHYSRIARADLANSNGQALLDQLVPPWGTGTMTLPEFVRLVDASGEFARFDETARRGQRFVDLQGVSTRLLRAYEAGKLEQARDPAEVFRSVSLLAGNSRQRAVGRERLITAGEYAMPQLLEVFRTRDGSDIRYTDQERELDLRVTVDGVLRTEVETTIKLMGRQALAPLQAALWRLEPALQEQFVGMLGDIPVRTSIPYLYDLHASTQSPAVRAACERAIAKLDGSVLADAPVATFYEVLAKAYYDGQDSLVSFPGEETQLVWNYDPQIGLTPVPIDSRVFHQAMAMRLTERALQINPQSRSALALWLASNFMREIQTPAGYANPLYPTSRPDAMFYAVAAGPAACQRVLAMALDSRSAPLARQAIAALGRTAGATALASGEFGRQPLLEALRFANRRVQYEAALVLAKAGPREPFAGAERVVPILAGIVGEAGSKFAVVISRDSERRNAMADQLRRLGYSVLAPASSLGELDGDIAAAPSIELVYAALPTGSTAALLDEVRERSKLVTTPVVAVADPDAQAELAPRFGRDATIAFIREGLTAVQFERAVQQVVLNATGGEISLEDAFLYQEKALAALRDIAVSNSPVYNLLDAAMPLSRAIEGTGGAVRLKIAEVLSYMNDRRVQTALFDAALASSETEVVDMLGHVAGSARRFGNLLADRQVRRLLEMAAAGGPDARSNAVASLLGALNLEGNHLLPLILNSASPSTGSRAAAE